MFPFRSRFGFGDVSFHYDFSALHDPRNCLTNLTIGAQASGAIKTITDDFLQTSADHTRFSVKWYNLRTLGAADDDDDGDGLSNWNEIFTHRSDPRNPDSDGDGLWDGEEIEHGLDPDSPDSFDDGTWDFWRVYDASVLTNAPWAAEGDILYTMYAELADSTPDAYAVLRLGRDDFMPVVPGGMTARFAHELDKNTHFTLIFGPTMTGAESFRIEINDIEYVTTPYAILHSDDPDEIIVFTDGTITRGGAGGAEDEGRVSRRASSMAPQRAGTAFAPSPSGGTLGASQYEIVNNPVCPHTGHGMVRVVAKRSYDANRYETWFYYSGQWYAERVFSENEPEYGALEIVDGVECAKISIIPAFTQINFDPLTNTVSRSQTGKPTELLVHHCGLYQNGSESVDISDPPYISGNSSFDLGHKAVIIGDPFVIETVECAATHSNTETWWLKYCPVCGCEWNASQTHTTTCRHAHDIDNSQHVAITGGGSTGDKETIFVEGVSPSADYAKDWMTHKAGGCTVTGNAYAHAKYTVLGFKNHLAPDTHNTTEIQHTLTCTTNDLVFWTGVGLPHGDLTVTLANIGSPDPDARLIIYNRKKNIWETLLSNGVNTVTMDIKEWHQTYTTADKTTPNETDYYALAKLACSEKGAVELTQHFSGSDSGVTINYTKKQTIIAHDGYAVRFWDPNDPQSAYDDHYGTGWFYNPSGIPRGESVRFKIWLDTPTEFPPTTSPGAPPTTKSPSPPAPSDST